MGQRARLVPHPVTQRLHPLAQGQCYLPAVREEVFWRIVEGCRHHGGADTERFAQLVLRSLRSLDPQEILEFEQLWFQAQDQLYHWPVWDAAALFLGRTGDDVFMAVQDWIVSHGRAVMKRVKDDPDSLVELVADRRNALIDWFCGLPTEAYIAATGHPPPFGGEPDGLDEPTGVTADLRDEADMRRRFPRITAYLDDKRWIARPWDNDREH